MSEKEKITQSFFSKFNRRFGLMVPGTQVYMIDEPNPKYFEWRKAEEEAKKTLSDEELEKWYEEHEMPPERDGESRFIPNDEDWDTVNSLMQESLEQEKDLLWERYKNNIIEPAGPRRVY